MIKPEQIPDGVYYAAHDAVSRGASIREVIAAALNAWPGMRMMVDIDTGDDAAIKLPLPPQEASDDPQKA